MNAAPKIIDLKLELPPPPKPASVDRPLVLASSLPNHIAVEIEAVFEIA